jgi:hypothetical protein
LIQSTIEVLQEHPNFHNETYDHVRAHAKMIVEIIQIHLEGRNQSIAEMREDEFNQMVRSALQNNFILPHDGVPPNVNDNAFRADSVSKTDEVEFTASTLQAQSNAAESSGNEPKKKGPQKYKYCGELRKGHVCSATRLFDAWTDTSMTESRHIPAESKTVHRSRNKSKTGNWKCPGKNGHHASRIRIFLRISNLRRKEKWLNQRSHEGRRKKKG